MRLSAETNHLVQKRLKMATQPLEVIACGIFGSFTFGIVYFCMASDVRYNSWLTSVLLGPVLFGILAVGITALATWRYKTGRSARGLYAVAICMWAGIAVGFLLGDRVWYAYTSNHYMYEDMATYVNVDPDSDKGQSFMDAGVVYFKESSYVLGAKSLSFHNGANYCVAPIVRQPIEFLPQSSQLETVSRFVPPRSGTVDFWAVGTDCCQDPQKGFTCGEVGSQIARSGLRLLNDNERQMYLLAVQEWSANTGLPVRHPLFFKWVKDPVAQIGMYRDDMWDMFWVYVIIFFFGSLIGGFLIHLLLNVVKMR